MGENKEQDMKRLQDQELASETEEASTEPNAVAKDAKQAKPTPKTKDTEIDDDDADDEAGYEVVADPNTTSEVTASGKSNGFKATAQKATDACKGAWSKTTAWLKKNPAKGVGIVTLGLCVVLLIGAACSGGGNAAAKGVKTLTAEQQQLVKQRTELKVGVSSKAFPPFVFEKYGGGYGGSDVDLMKAVCKATGWKLTIVPIDWSNRQELLAIGEVDCLWDGFNSYGREDYYAWTDTYLDMSDVVVVSKKDNSIKELGDLENKTVAVLNGSNPSRELEHLGLALTRVACSTLEECQQMLDKKEADAIAVSMENAANLKNVRILDDPLEARLYAVACDEHNTDLRDILNYYIDSVSTGGTK